jgi:hypothetical protein
LIHGVENENGNMPFVCCGSRKKSIDGASLRIFSKIEGAFIKFHIGVASKW